MYSQLALEHIQRPRNVGRIEDADAYAEITNPACGDVLKLTLKITDGVISDIRYHVYGCPASVAASSIVSEMVKGMSLEHAGALKRQDLQEAIGLLPTDKRHAIALVHDALREALGQITQ